MEGGQDSREGRVLQGKSEGAGEGGEIRSIWHATRVLFENGGFRGHDGHRAFG